MQKLRFLLVSGLLLLVAVSILSCGANHQQLQSVSISPATADAQNYPNGQVQFTATGTYVDGSKVSPLTALWSVNSPWAMASLPVPPIFLNGAGLASCNGFTGTFVIVATAPIDPRMPLSKMTMTTPQVSGQAQLICP